MRSGPAASCRRLPSCPVWRPQLLWSGAQNISRSAAFKQPPPGRDARSRSGAEAWKEFCTVRLEESEKNFCKEKFRNIPPFHSLSLLSQQQCGGGGGGGDVVRFYGAPALPLSCGAAADFGARTLTAPNAHDICCAFHDLKENRILTRGQFLSPKKLPM